MADLPALELFCGIGGFAAAVQSLSQSEVGARRVQVVGALDLSPHVLDVYRHNFSGHGARQAHLDFLPAEQIAAFGAQMWWMSPPCQPYTTRGLQRDLEDSRAQSLVRLIGILREQLPDYLGLENVPGFVGSDAHALVVQTLSDAGYAVRERVLCPTELGIPARRERYYLVASRRPLKTPGAERFVQRRLTEFLDPALFEGEIPSEYLIPPEILAKHGPGMRLLDPWNEPETIANTVTGAYGKTWQAAGAYLRLPDGRVRRFTPAELLGLLGFPADFVFPQGTPLRHQYKMIGNSLSVFAMREVLRDLF